MRFTSIFLAILLSGLIFLSIGIGFLFSPTPVWAATFTVTADASSITIQNGLYQVVLNLGDTSDYVLIKDENEDPITPDTTYELVGPYIQEGGIQYQLRWDNKRQTDLLEVTDTRVRVRVRGCLDTSVGGSCLSDGTIKLEVSEDYIFTNEGLFVENQTNFQSAGIALDSASAEDGYNWLMLETDITDAAFSGTVFYGNGTTETSISSDASFEDSNVYVVLEGGGSYQSALVGIAKGGWLNQTGGTDNWNYDSQFSGNLDKLHTREQSTTPTGIKKAYWYIQLQPQSETDSEIERESFSNYYQNPDNLDDGFLVSPQRYGWAWNDSSELTDAGADDYWNESEGLYALEASTSGTTHRLAFDIDAGTYTHHAPFVKYRNYRSLTLPTNPTLEGSELILTTQYNIDSKPLSRAFFTNELTYYAPLQSTDANVGGNLSNSGCSFVSGKYGNGAQCNANSEDLAVTIAEGTDYEKEKGTIEFWYQPEYDYNDGAEHYLFSVRLNDNHRISLFKDTSDALVFRYTQNAGNVDYTVAGGNYTWDSTDWVHVRLEWDDTEATATQQRLFFNGTQPTHTDSATDLDSSLLSAPTTLYLGNENDSTSNEANGLLDEFKIYDSDSAIVPLARGGDETQSEEYLGDTTNDYTITFVDDDSNNRAEYLWLGSEDEFEGLNIDLETPGVEDAAIDFDWEYWDGATWSALSVTESTVNASSFEADGNFYFTAPSDWAVYALDYSPSLYYIRGHLESGSYSTFPIENEIRTDIVLFQYLGKISADNQTLAIPVLEPALTFTIGGVNLNVVNNQITTSVSSTYSSLPFGNLVIGTPKYAAHQLAVTTNTAQGYTINIKMVSGNMQGIYPANIIDPYAGGTWSVPTAWTEPTGTQKNVNSAWLGANTTDTRVTGWSGSPQGKFGPVSTTSHTVMQSTEADEMGTTIYVTYAVEANGYHVADVYSGQLMYLVIPTY